MFYADRVGTDRTYQIRGLSRTCGFYCALLAICVLTFLPTFHLVWHATETGVSVIASQCSDTTSGHDGNGSCGYGRNSEQESHPPIEEDCGLCAAEGSFSAALLDFEQAASCSPLGFVSVSLGQSQIYSWLENEHPGRAPPSVLHPRA